MNAPPQVVVAGHICLDIIPAFDPKSHGRIEPGRLTEIGASTLATGGAVSNTGVALHRLGVPTRLMGKVGDDLFGVETLNILRRHGSSLADGMLVCPNQVSSYTFVISPPGVDRMFLHCPGANNTFSDDDIRYDQLKPARFFHFGYPTLMRQMFIDDGRRMASIFRRVRELGLITSLDFTVPDASSPCGKIDWLAFFRNVLPHTDMFVPSLEELVFTLDRPRFPCANPTGTLLDGWSNRLIDLGVAIVMIKLGEQGIYLRTTHDSNRLSKMGFDAPAWTNQRLHVPCFKVRVANTLGAGDCAIAGFLAALLRNQPPGAAITTAAAVGACCCDKPDAFSGVPTWDALQERMSAPWERLPVSIDVG